jgi:Domain of unknown function (DUF4872)/Butirosin biosynthesis protein H, N-terminal
MTATAFAGFRPFPTLHCVTGSMRHIYDFHGYPISEDLLLGLGGGVGFVYWHMKGQLPFLGGRANVGRPGELGLPRTAGMRTGVAVEEAFTSSAVKAEKALVAHLDVGTPVMIGVDMGLLPYFDFPEEYHFGGHVVVVCGWDGDEALVADRDAELQPVPLAAIGAARGSRFKPFPPRNVAWDWDFREARPPGADEVRDAIRDVVHGMLEPPIANLGVRGIATAAKRIQAWPRALTPEQVQRTCFECFIFIDATGGTGGGIFRYMYGRFLTEAAAITGTAELADVGADFAPVGDAWQAVAGRFRQAGCTPDAAEHVSDISAAVAAIAPQEEQLWRRLDAVVGRG